MQSLERELERTEMGVEHSTCMIFSTQSAHVAWNLTGIPDRLAATSPLDNHHFSR
jgi:hypothetical protein